MHRPLPRLIHCRLQWHENGDFWQNTAQKRANVAISPHADIVLCCQVGLWLREIFEHFGLQSFPKTSGSKGLQIYVPLNTETGYGQTKPFAHAVALLVAAAFVGRRAPAPRPGDSQESPGHPTPAKARDARVQFVGATQLFPVQSFMPPSRKQQHGPSFALYFSR